LTEHSDLWAVAAAATLMVMLRCGPILLPSEPITRHSRALTIASHVAIGFALLSALYRLFSLDAASIIAGLVFAGSGFIIFVTFRSLPTALIGATVIYAGVRLVL
jgi:hypothetical protein